MTRYTASHAAKLVAAFDSSGVHRASTPGDAASGAWLCDEAARTGAAATRMPVRLDRTVVDHAYLEHDGERIDGLPMFDSPSTGEAVLHGTLVPCGEAGDFGYLELAPNAASIKGMSFEAIRRDCRHTALVVATRISGESLAPINAQYFTAPFGPPVLQVAGMHHERLARLAAGRSRMALAARHWRERAESFNVVARLAGGGTAPVVLLTPRTGWWESTAERAGGLVGWLAGLAAAAALGERRTQAVHAFATCGHELGHVGLHALLDAEAALVREAPCWLHLGANLGCASSVAMILRASDAADATAMRERLATEGYPADAIRIEPIGTASGEARDVIEHGGRVLSLIGTNAHFHAASDRWPGNVSATRVAAIARAVQGWVEDRARA